MSSYCLWKYLGNDCTCEKQIMQIKSVPIHFSMIILLSCYHHTISYWDLNTDVSHQFYCLCRRVHTMTTPIDSRQNLLTGCSVDFDACTNYLIEGIVVVTGQKKTFTSWRKLKLSWTKSMDLAMFHLQQLH